MRPNIKQMKERIEFLDHQMDRLLLSNYELKEENRNYQEEIVSLKSSLNNRPLEGSHYCDCGAQAYIYYMIDGGKYYCGECFQGKYIKNLGVALQQIKNQKNTIDVQTQTLNEQSVEIAQLKKLSDSYAATLSRKPQGTHFCSFCGERAYIYRIEEKSKNSKCYCDYCFKKLVIKFEDKA